MRIAITRDDGGVSIMNISRRHALNSEASMEEIVRVEIAKWEAPGHKAVGWREIEEKDVPARESRNAYVDDGQTIAIDPARIKVPEPDPRDEIADLKARLEKLETDKNKPAV